MPLKLAASQYTSAVLLGIAGQSERGKYAAHSRQMPWPPGVEQVFYRAAASARCALAPMRM